MTSAYLPIAVPYARHRPGRPAGSAGREPYFSDPLCPGLVRMTVAQAISDADETRTRAALLLVGVRSGESGSPTALKQVAARFVPRNNEWLPLPWNESAYALIGHGYASTEEVLERARGMLGVEGNGSRRDPGGAVAVVGIGLYPEDGIDADELIERAEEALQDGLTLGYRTACFSMRCLRGRPDVAKHRTNAVADCVPCHPSSAAMCTDTCAEKEAS